jgi:hypothetical protein
MRILLIIYQAIFAKGKTAYENDSKRQAIPINRKERKEL